MNKKISAFILVILFVVFGFFSPHFLSHKSLNVNNKVHASKLEHRRKASKVIRNTAISPTKALAPTSAPTIAPAPVLTGFCLNVPVLFYHHVQPESVGAEHKNTSLTVDNGTFDKQMQYLVSHGYTTITVKQLVDALKNHTTLPTKSIAITLDDGYRDNYTYAFPILQKYKLTANIMLATGLMEGPDYLTWGQVNEMKNSGLIYYSDHTWSHYSVNHGTNEKIQYEIQTAKQQIESHTGQTTDIFTYPYGSLNANAIALLQQDGFTGAFSTIPGKVQCDSFIMSLHRTRIGNAPLSAFGI